MSRRSSAAPIMTPVAPDQEAGFTLVELLVSVTLLAVLTIVLAGGMKLATSRFTRDPEQVERAARVALVQDFVNAKLADARPILDLSAASRRIAFEGRATEVLFLAPASESAPKSGLMAFGLRFRPSASGDGRLELGARSFDVPSLSAGRTTILLDHVAKLRFSYYGTGGPGGTPGWTDAWDSPQILPRLIRISLGFADGSSAPDLFVALRIASAPSAASTR